MSVTGENQREIESAIAYAARFRGHATALAEHAQAGRRPAGERWEALLGNVDDLLASVLRWLERQTPVSENRYERELLNEAIREVSNKTQSRAALAPTEVADLSASFLEFAHALEHCAGSHHEPAERPPCEDRANISTPVPPKA